MNKSIAWQQKRQVNDEDEIKENKVEPVVEVEDSSSVGISLFNNMLKKAAKAAEENTAATEIIENDKRKNIEDDLKQYLKMPALLKLKDLLCFWKKNDKFLPHLSAVAKELLSMQASNWSSEWTNSIGGFIVSKETFLEQ